MAALSTQTSRGMLEAVRGCGRVRRGVDEGTCVCVCVCACVCVTLCMRVGARSWYLRQALSLGNPGSDAEVSREGLLGTPTAAPQSAASVASEDSLDAQARAAAGAGCPRLRRALCALLDAPQNNLQLRVRGERIMGLSTRPDGINNTCVRKEVGDVLAQAWAVCSEGSLDPATSFCRWTGWV